MKNFPQRMNKVFWFWVPWQRSNICRFSSHSITQATQGEELYSSFISCDCWSTYLKCGVILHVKQMERSSEGLHAVQQPAFAIPSPQHLGRAVGVLLAERSRECVFVVRGGDKGSEKKKRRAWEGQSWQIFSWREGTWVREGRKGERGGARQRMDFKFML